MKVNLRESSLDPEVKILGIEGRIDAYTHAILREELHTLLNIGSNKIVCVLSKVEYIGPAGLRAFLSAIEQARQSGGDIKLSSVPANVLKRFEFAGFSEICHFYQNAGDAEKFFFQAGQRQDDVDLYAPTVQVSRQDIKNELSQGPRTLPIDDEHEASPGADTLMIENMHTERLDHKVLAEMELQDVREEATKKLDPSKLETDKFENKGIQSDQKEITQEIDFDEEDAKTQKLHKDVFSTEQSSVDIEKRESSQLPPQIIETISQKIDKLEKAPAEEMEKKHDKSFSFPVTYYIYQKMGEGYLGKVYYGKEVSLHGFSRKVVLKYIKNQYSHNRSIMKLLTQEMQQAVLVQHQNLVQLHNLVSLEKYSFLVMEYVDGKTIAAIIQKLRRKNRVFPPDIACLIAYTLCAALHYTNNKTDENGQGLDLAHGEINCENVMINRDKDVKLLGLGIAKVDLMLQFQQSPATMKNLEYLAPEVLSTGIPCVSGDIFSLGVLFYEMLTGHKPYTQEQIRRQDMGLPLPPSNFNKKINDIIDGLVLRCLMVDTYRRFQGFQDIALQLESSLQNKGFLLSQAALEKFLENNEIFT